MSSDENQVTEKTGNKSLVSLAAKLDVSEDELKHVIVNTVMPSNKQPTKEQFVAFVSVANLYGLNPLVKEIYAFPTQGGGIQPIVSIDGWLKIINTHPDFDGMTFDDQREDGKLVAVTCNIYKKGIKHPVQVTEYMEECAMGTAPWKKYPARMLRHKATIQCGRYAFGISGIIDPDEADRYKDSGVIAKEDGDLDGEVIMPDYDQAKFEKNLPIWTEQISSKKRTSEDIIAIIESKAKITPEQLEIINKLKASDDEE